MAPLEAVTDQFGTPISHARPLGTCRVGDVGDIADMDQSVNVIDMALIRDQIRDFIQQNFLFGGDLSRLDDTTSLLEQGIVDSTGILELVLFCEETYGFGVESADLLPENFDSVRSISSYVARRLSDEE